MAFALRDYQVTSVNNLKRGWQGTQRGNTYPRQLLVLATGLGKTVVFANAIEWAVKELKGRCLVLAHREELLQQAEEKLVKVMGYSEWEAVQRIGREQASSYALENHEIVTASVMTWGVRRSESQWNDRMSRFKRDHFKLIVIDEAHHAVADSYQHILDYFTPEGSQTYILGVTATPKRGDGESIKKAFDRVAFQMDIVDGTKAGWLAPVVSHRVSSSTDLRAVRTTAGDFNLKDLALAVNNTQRNSLILNTYMREQFRGRQCVVFATDLEHARAMSREFADAGFTSSAISGDMDKEMRRNAIANFKAGKIDVLTNYGVLTEGFDYEDLDLIINARPTKSSLLLTQILGRATRKPAHRPNKIADFIEIIDLHSDETATASSIFGFMQKFDCEGHHFLECIQEAERMEKEKDYYSPWKAPSWSRMQADFQKAVKWDGPTAQPNREWCFDNRYRYYITQGQNLILKHKDDEGVNYTVRITESPLGGFEGTIHAKQGDEIRKTFEFSGETRFDVVNKIENCIMAYYPKWDILLNINAAWRRRAQGEPCTDKQWNLMEKFRLTRGRERSQISKADAMNEIGKFFANK